MRTKAGEFWRGYKFFLETIYWMIGLVPVLAGLLLWFGEHRFYEVRDIPFLVAYYLVWLVIFRLLPIWPFRRE
ncbi:MAG TPA: hypothetical protein VF986_02645 [Actinomycetota bacterium]